LSSVHPNAAANDIGVTMQVLAVGPDCDDRPVRRFRTFTEDLHRLADCFARCCVMAVVSNVTGATGTGIIWPGFGAPAAASMVDRCLGVSTALSFEARDSCVAVSVMRAGGPIQQRRMELTG
jgi:hypothetical protein